MNEERSPPENSRANFPYRAILLPVISRICLRFFLYPALRDVTEVIFIRESVFVSISRGEAEIILSYTGEAENYSGKVKDALERMRAFVSSCKEDDR